MPQNQLHSWLNAVLLGFLLLLVYVQGQASLESSPIRTTHTGQVLGKLIHVKDTKAGVYTFLGIPFGKPPEGPLRFGPPEAPETWGVVRDGNTHPAMCLQNLELLYPEGMKEMKLNLFSFSMSEDCLYLNIYAPAHACEGSNLPVNPPLPYSVPGSPEEPQDTQVVLDSDHHHILNGCQSRSIICGSHSPTWPTTMDPYHHLEKTG